MSAYAFLGARRRETDMALLLSVIALGAQGDGEAINKQMKRWES